MKKRILLFILLIALILRLAGIGSEPYWTDEVITVRWVQEPLKTALDVFVNSELYPPMYMLTLWVWVRFFGITPIATRLLSTLFSIMTIFVIYLVGKKLFSEKVGLIASVILAFSNFNIYYAQETRAYSFLVFLTLVSFYYFILSLEKLSLKNSLLYLFSTLILIYTHVFSLLIIFVQNIYFLLIQYKSLKIIKKWIFIQIQLLILYIPWFPILLKQITKQDHLNLKWIPVLHWYSPLVVIVKYSGSTILFIVFIVIIIYAFIKARKKIPLKQISLLSMWIIIPIGIMFLFSFVVRPLFHERFFQFVVPAIILIISWAIKVSFGNKWVLSGVVALIIILSFPPIYEQYYTTNKDDWITASEFLNENVKNGEIIFIHPFYQQYPFTYYYNRQCFTESNMYACNYRTKDILSLPPLAKCCNGSTILTSTTENNYMGDYTSIPLWVVDVRSQNFYKDSNLYKYLNDTMDYQNTTEFYGDILIHRYNPKQVEIYATT
ncbi:glycosyltransferase family 39 protein [Candidatus Woesearchaeota archaeon]|nr:glycosyltransferase family 39 protein [Candidatus Woesearchaeota archaeon]